MGDTSPNHNSNYRNPKFYYTGTLDRLGDSIDASAAPTSSTSACVQLQSTDPWAPNDPYKQGPYTIILKMVYEP